MDFFRKDLFEELLFSPLECREFHHYINYIWYLEERPDSAPCVCAAFLVLVVPFGTGATGLSDSVSTSQITEQTQLDANNSTASNKSFTA